MKKAVQGIFTLALLLLFASTVLAGGAAGLDAEEALKKLMDGNRRFVSETYDRGDIGPGRRAEISKGQRPFAVIVDCSDSRVVPEFIFDQGLGDLFVIRTAGNIVDDIAIGSVEYAVKHLGVRVVLVLGWHAALTSRNRLARRASRSRSGSMRPQAKASSWAKCGAVRTASPW